MTSARARVPYAQVAGAAIAWGSWSLVLRPAAMDPRWASAIVLGAIAVAGAPLLSIAGNRGPLVGGPRAAREWGWIALLGVVDALNVGAFFGALSVTTVAVAVLSHYLAPLIVAVAAPRFLGTRARRGTIALATTALVGLALVLEPWRMSSDDGSNRTLVGAALGATSALFYAANVLITKRIGPRFKSVEQLVYHSIVSTAVLAGAALIAHAPLPSGPSFTAVALAGAVIGATAGLMFLRGLERIPAEHASMLTFLEPLTAVTIGWLWWHERPGRLALVGGAIVLAAGALSMRSDANSSVTSTSA